MPKIKINDISMYYEMYGEGEPLVFISGFSADHVGWFNVYPKFAEKYKVILLDNRGSGQTDVPLGPYSVAQMADDVIMLCDKLNIKEAHFVGSSMGGHIVQTLAYRYPQYVKSAVMSNSAMASHTGYIFYLQAYLELLQANVSLRTLTKAVFSWIFSYNFLAKVGQFNILIELSLNNPYPFTLTGFEGQYAALKTFDSRTWAKEIKVPALVISGEQDIVLNAFLSEELAKEIPNARYHCFKQCGHLPHIEYPVEYIKVIGDFINSI